MILSIRQRALAVVALYDDANDKMIMTSEPQVVTMLGDRLLRRQDGFYLLMDNSKYGVGDEVRIDIKVPGFFAKSVELTIKERLLPDDIINVRLTANSEHTPSGLIQLFTGVEKEDEVIGFAPVGIRAAFHLITEMKAGSDIISMDVPVSQRLEGKLLYITENGDREYTKGTYVRVKGAGSRNSYMLCDAVEKDLSIASTVIYPVTEVKCDSNGKYECMLSKGEYKLLRPYDD